MLASTAEEGVLERLLQQQSSRGELDDLYVHRINVRGKEMIGAFYGDYQSYSEAEMALKQLPQVLNRFQPYLRNMQQILAESITQQDLISMNIVKY
jgi:septal ring-binding cell division protein DamX